MDSIKANGPTNDSISVPSQNRDREKLSPELSAHWGSQDISSLLDTNREHRHLGVVRQIKWQNTNLTMDVCQLSDAGNVRSVAASTWPSY